MYGHPHTDALRPRIRGSSRRQLQNSPAAIQRRGSLFIPEARSASATLYDRYAAIRVRDVKGAFADNFHNT